MTTSSHPGSNQDASAVYSHLRHQAASPTSQPDLERDQSETAGNYGYGQGHQFPQQIQEQPLQYGNDFGPDGNRQQFQPYSQTLLYNMASPASQPASYEAVAQFNPRPPSTIEVISNQFNVPQYFNSEHSSRASQHPQPYSTSSYQQSPHFPPRTSSIHSVASNQYIGTVADVSSANLSAIMDPVDSPQHHRNDGDTFSDFYESHREVLRAVHRGDLLQASLQLLQLSEWISSHAVELGLTRDDQVPYNERLELWDSFNLCWLVLLQRQKDDSHDMIDHGQSPPSGRTILQEDMLERMARELTRICDGLERHGLVDYQMGFWEEEIMNILLDCLRLLEGDLENPRAHDTSPSQTQQAGVLRRST